MVLDVMLVLAVGTIFVRKYFAGWYNFPISYCITVVFEKTHH